MASQNTPGKPCSCSEGRAGTPQHKRTEPSRNNVYNMMRASPMVMMAAVVVMTRPKKNNVATWLQEQPRQEHVIRKPVRGNGGMA